MLAFLTLPRAGSAMGQQASGPQCPLPRQEIVTLYADGTVQADGAGAEPAQQVRPGELRTCSVQCQWCFGVWRAFGGLSGVPGSF